VYGPVCTVVWQGSAGDRRPYADQKALSESTHPQFQNLRLLEQARSTLTPPDHVTCSQYAANRIASETFGTVWAGLGGRKEIGAGLLAGTSYRVRKSLEEEELMMN
jgi:hypothetical protein